MARGRFERLLTNSDGIDDDSDENGQGLLWIDEVHWTAHALTLRCRVEWRWPEPAPPPGLAGPFEVTCGGVLGQSLALGCFDRLRTADDDPRIWRWTQPWVQIFVAGRSADPHATACRVAIRDASIRQHAGDTRYVSLAHAVDVLTRGSGQICEAPAAVATQFAEVLAADGVETNTLPAATHAGPDMGRPRLLELGGSWVIAASFTGRDL